MRCTGESGSALVEAAIVIPVLLLLVCGSVALTDALVLKLKLAEALRYALWESTLFKAPAKIEAEVRARFADLRSPSAVRSQSTGLVLYPHANDRLKDVATANGTPTSLRTSRSYPSSARSLPTSSPDCNSDAVTRTVDPATRTMGFNTHGLALARIALEANAAGRSAVVNRGEVPAAPPLRRFRLRAPLASQRPMQLVFDTWKAWPKPAAYTSSDAGTDVRIAPARTYPEVERQVSAQVRRMAFLGARRIPGFDDLRAFASRLVRAGATRMLAGGTLPDIFSTGRMDGPDRGPITILPPERAAESWVPHRCEIAGADVPCPTQRAGDVTSAGAPRYLEGGHTIGDRVDRTRYTVPYRIRTTYWSRYGGMDRELDSALLDPVDPRIAAENGYVRTYRCRGHFFGGSQKAQTASGFGGCR